MAERGTGEEQRERYRELLEELRTIQPGVQVLFAFLLTVPFTTRFDDVDRFGHRLWVAAIVITGVAAFCFIAPAAFHRLGDTDRAQRVRVAVKLQVAGLTGLGIAMVLAVVVVVRFVFGGDWGATVGVVTAAVGLLLWYVLPMVVGRRASRPK